MVDLIIKRIKKSSIIGSLIGRFELECFNLEELKQPANCLSVLNRLAALVLKKLSFESAKTRKPCVLSVWTVFFL